jgi:hypothetical protein
VDSTGSRTRRGLWLAAIAAIAWGCATARLPPPEVLAAAHEARSYSASLRVSVKGPELRGRARALLAFERPDALRLEVPGPGGLQLLAVARDGRLTALLPRERAVFQGPADGAAFEALLGIELTPREVMDLLVGAPVPRLASCRTSWGPRLPRRVEARLADGTRLDVRVEDAEAGGPLPAGAFEAPRHAGYRSVDAREARRLWLGGER